MAGKQKNDDGMINDINITPMVDIMLVLLIIFMVTANIIVTPAIPVKLPSASTGETLETKTISIVITKDNKFFVEGKIIKQNKIKIYLQKEKDKLNSENLKKEKKKKLQVVIAADKDAKHGKVMKIVDIIRIVGINDYAFSIEDE